MESNSTNDTMNTLEGLVKNPSQIADILKDPGKHGLDFYNGLSNRQKQYVLLAAGIGLVAFAIYTGRQPDYHEEENDQTA
ncbi:hypothetical protein [Pontibacter cellulosilyticus]|uniref:Uncharacterized protein n=1 Tax=Pontibacter cellulosilyticus TaxID=1720253 RepID=A0A923SHW5_9BACT|nr:hypothetical protein [Pontibacter cellulosilyticus]MBC5991987.1 hypothetical protein [Pontibacter cellulosilyticus]